MCSDAFLLSCYGDKNRDQGNLEKTLFGGFGFRRIESLVLTAGNVVCRPGAGAVAECLPPDQQSRSEKDTLRVL